MANYFITGKLGAGKTLCAVGKIQDHLWKGLKVATNLDLHLDIMLGPKWENCEVFRVPDKPDVEHLQQLGFGCEEKDYSEDKFGLLVLDELGTWFNNRNWNDKGRKELIDFLIHLRKFRWHGLFIVQDISMVDPQLRKSLGEHLVICKRLDRMRIPLFGWILAWFGPLFNHGKMPKIHIALVYYGQSTNQPHVERWVFRGTDLYSAYETGQHFSDGQELINGEYYDGRGNYQYLPPMVTHGIFLEPKKPRTFKGIVIKPINKAYSLINRVFGCKPDRWLISQGIKKPSIAVASTCRSYFLPKVNSMFLISETTGNIYYSESRKRSEQPYPDDKLKQLSV